MGLAAIYDRFAQSSIAKRLAVGAAWNIGGALFERLAALVSTVIVVRILGRDAFGEFAILQSTLSTAGVFVGLGLGITATKYVAELKSCDPLRLSRILAFAQRAIVISGVFVVIGLSLGADWLAASVLNTPHAKGLIAIGCIAVLLTALDGYQTGAALGFEAVRESALATLLAALVSVPLTLALTVGYGIEGAVWGLVLAAGIKCCASRWVFTRCLALASIPRSPQGILGEWRALRDFALPAFLSVGMVMPAHWVSQTMLVNASDGHAQLAMLTVSMQWFYAALFLPMAAGRILLPVLTSSLAEGNAAGSRRVLLSGVGATALMVLPATLLLSLMAPWILELYGPQFADGARVMVVLMVAAGLSAICAPIGQMLAARSQMWIGLAMNFAWAASYITLSHFLLSEGALGVALALLGAYALHSLGVGAFVWRGAQAQRLSNTVGLEAQASVKS